MKSRPGFQRKASVMTGLDLSPQSRPDLDGLPVIKKGSGSRSTWAAYLKKKSRCKKSRRDETIVEKGKHNRNQNPEGVT